jgi:hypothetical protein
MCAGLPGPDSVGKHRAGLDFFFVILSDYLFASKFVPIHREQKVNYIRERSGIEISSNSLTFFALKGNYICVRPYPFTGFIRDIEKCYFVCKFLFYGYRFQSIH